MKAVTFTVKLTESNIELLHEFKENKQLGLLIRTYFDALAYDRGGTLANLIGLQGGDIVKSSIVATTEVANHYKAYLESGLKDKIEFSDYMEDVEKFTKLPHEGYYGRGLTEKAVKGILENFLSEIQLNNAQNVEPVSNDKLEDMVTRLLEQKLSTLGLSLGGVQPQNNVMEAVKPAEITSEDTQPTITPKVEVKRTERPEMAQEDVKNEVELDTAKVDGTSRVDEDVATEQVEKVDVKVVKEEEDLKSESIEAQDVFMNLGF